MTTSTPPPRSPTQKPRNILLLIADDLGKYIGSYGCKSVVTPHLDALSAQGVRFTSAFASTASCSGSRSTIFTGLHTHENGQYGLMMPKKHFKTFDHVDSLTNLLKEHKGYFTGIVGKVHVGPRTVYNWDIWDEMDTRDVAVVVDRCEDFFKQAKEREESWYLTVGFIDPHRDITTRGGFGNDTTHDSRVPVLDVKPEDVEVPSWLTDLPETRQEFVEYYKAIHRMDAGVGLILQALEKQGMSDDTLVVFTSDNGPPFVNSKTTLFEAGTNLPLIVRAPGITNSAKGKENPNMVSFIDIMPSLLEWAQLPTTARISETSPPRLGRSFLSILPETKVLPEGNTDGKWQHHVFGSHTFHELQNYWPTRILRTRRYKYHRNIAWRLDFPFAADLYASLSFDAIRNTDFPYPIGKRALKDYIFRPREQLFDLEEDPDELCNLINEGEEAAGMTENVRNVLEELRGRMDEWQKETKDLWWNRDGVSLLMVGRYKADGLKVPDRLDFSVESPGNTGVKTMQY